MISILDYGLGNSGSVQNMISKIGKDSKIISSVEEIFLAEKLIIPGVGSFDKGMENLDALKFIEPLNEVVLNKKIPIIGICLGMQLMCNSSEEGVHAGLGWIDAKVKKFKRTIDGDIKVPHMGWNSVMLHSKSSLNNNLDDDTRFYFVHSYYVECLNKNDSILKCKIGNRIFDAAFEKSNIRGCQFHPEKSHRYGMQFLKNFINIQNIA